MTVLLWDQPGERFYETGVDRGVLYLSDNSGVPWNGLTALEEDFNAMSSTPTYFDGVKSRDSDDFGPYSASLSAFTYPDEFLEYEGILPLGNGLSVDGQRAKTFGLSYRTRLGNDTEGTDYGYKLHVLYNLSASPADKTNDTLTETPSLAEFKWGLSSVPVKIDGYRPTAHLIFNSTTLDPVLLSSIEDILYGSDVSNSRLPSVDELISMIP